MLPYIIFINPSVVLTSAKFSSTSISHLIVNWWSLFASTDIRDGSSRWWLSFVILEMFWIFVVLNNNSSKLSFSFDKIVSFVLMSMHKQNYIRYCTCSSFIKFGTVLLPAAITNLDTVLISNIWSFKCIIMVPKHD